MKLFWQKAEVQKFEHAKDFAEEYNIGKNDLFLQVKVHMRHILHHLGWKHMWNLKVNMEKASLQM